MDSPLKIVKSLKPNLQKQEDDVILAKALPTLKRMGVNYLIIAGFCLAAIVGGFIYFDELVNDFQDTLSTQEDFF